MKMNFRMKYPGGKIKMNRIKSFLIIMLLQFFAVALPAQNNDPCYPSQPNRLVNDFVGILDQNQLQALESKLVQFNKQTSNQISIIITDTLCGTDAAAYTYQIGESWKVGQEEFDNGIVLMVKPTGGSGDRHTFIATGYGLEGAIPDATAKLIVDNELLPNFRQDNYYKGIDAATNVLMELAIGEYNHQQYNEKVNKGPGLVAILPFLFVFLIWFLLVFTRAKKYANTNGLGFWAALMLLNASGRSHGGSFSSFSGGSGGFGGGGGGFGGFGGGSFGGGGAGGSW